MIAITYSFAEDGHYPLDCLGLNAPTHQKQIGIIGPMKLQHLKMQILKVGKRFLNAEKGSTAAMFGIAAVPFFAAAGLAIDYNRVLQARSELQAMADASALAGAATSGSATVQENVAMAFLNSHDVSYHGLTFSGEANASHAGQFVEVTINANIEGSILGVLSTGGFGGPDEGDDFSANTNIVVRSKARYIDVMGGRVCVLTLNETADKALHIQGNGSITATDCGLHSDSSSPEQALYMNGNGHAAADFFHTVGGWSKAGAAGSFSPTPESGKSRRGNPFNLSTAGCPSGASSNNASLTSNNPLNPTTISAGTYNNISVGSNRHGRLNSGTYYITGTVNVQGTLTATHVTLVLCGANARISMGAQGKFKLQAPTAGTYPGFAVVANSNAVLTNSLVGGPQTYVRGIWYTPKAALTIGGNSAFNSQSSYFPVVADKFHVYGTGGVQIGIDHEAYGYAEPTELLTATSRNVWLSYN